MSKRLIPKKAVPRRPSSGVEIDFDHSEKQQMRNWCWAACVTVVAKKRQQTNATITQCSIAQSIPALSGRQCCPSQSGFEGAACNIAADLAAIDDLFKSYSPRMVRDKGFLDIVDMRKQLDNDKLVCVFLKSPRYTSEHMVMVYGYSGSGFLVWDPDEDMPDATLAHSAITNYKGSSFEWTETWKGL